MNMTSRIKVKPKVDKKDTYFNLFFRKPKRFTCRVRTCFFRSMERPHALPFTTVKIKGWKTINHQKGTRKQLLAEVIKR